MYNFQHFLWDMNKCIGTNSCNKSGDARKKKRRRRHTHFLAHLGVSKLINSLSFCVVCANWIMGGEKYSKELNLNCRRVTWTSQPFVKDAVIGGIMWFSWCDSIHVILVHGIGRLCFFLFCRTCTENNQKNVYSGELQRCFYALLTDTAASHRTRSNSWEMSSVIVSNFIRKWKSSHFHCAPFIIKFLLVSVCLITT